MDPDVPTVTILLLGEAEVGKSTFLSRLTLGRDGRQSPEDATPPPYSLPVLRDLDQPFSFGMRLYAKSYRCDFFDTASPTSYVLLHPDYIILVYDISRRDTLHALKTHWAPLVNETYNVAERIPVMVLGLKRDLRRPWTADERAAGGRGASVMPHEGLGVAQMMRVDQYAECSALTGELCTQVLEDIAKTAARTTTERGGLSDGGCLAM